MKRGRKPVEADRILDAACRVFSKQGFFQSTVDGVCAEAGVGKGTVYRHFPDKDHVLVALLVRATRELDANVSAGILARGGREESLTAVARITLDYFARRPDLLRIFVREGALSIPVVRKTMASTITQFNARIAGLLGGRSMVRPAAVFNGMIFGLLRQRLGISDQRVHPAKDAAYLVDLFLHGFRP